VSSTAPRPASRAGIGSIAQSRALAESLIAAVRQSKTVTTGGDSPISRRVTASHRVTANRSILLTGHHGTPQHSQLPKLDVGSIPIVTDPGRDAGRLEPRRPRLPTPAGEVFERLPPGLRSP
jgi:hypothetical protein